MLWITGLASDLWYAIITPVEKSPCVPSQGKEPPGIHGFDRQTRWRDTYLTLLVGSYSLGTSSPRFSLFYITQSIDLTVNIDRIPARSTMEFRVNVPLLEKSEY